MIPAKAAPKKPPPQVLPKVEAQPNTPPPELPKLETTDIGRIQETHEMEMGLRLSAVEEAARLIEESVHMDVNVGGTNGEHCN